MIQRAIRWYKQPNVWIPSCFFGMFLVIFVANGTMIGVGMGSWRGLVTDDAYDKGLVYQQAIEAEQREDALGWSVDLSVEHPQPKRVDVRISLTDDQGQPLQADRVQVGFVRPTQEGYDSVHTLDALGGGTFGKTVDLPLKGLWELRIEAEKNGKAVRVSRRITVTE
nr:FixH family protein [Rhodovibrio salinarum]